MPMKLTENFARRSRLRDVGRWHVTKFVREVARTVAPGSRLLDAGAGECVYQDQFPALKYVAVDLAVGNAAWNYHNLDCIAALHRLPFRDAAFDVILCTQTLEHLEWPRESVAEFHRILKPAGRLFLTAPMAQNEHQIPHDFFRYTSYGLRSLCRHAGFREVVVQPLGGRFARWAYELPRAMGIFPPTRPPTVTRLLLLPVKAVALLAIRLLQLALLALDPLDQLKDDPFGWSVVAQK